MTNESSSSDTSSARPTAPMRELEFTRRDQQELEARSIEFRQLMEQRRTVRDFSNTAVPESVIANAIATAASAPSGANMQPWHFSAIQDPDMKHKIRLAAEEEEREFYDHRASEEWLDALSPFATDASKPFLETAPWLIAIFARKFTFTPEGNKLKHYYTPESVGIATGLLIASLHNAGLATLTHTPSPMGFLREILERPKHEKPFLLLVTGYPTENALVPDIKKLPLNQIMTRW